MYCTGKNCLPVDSILPVVLQKTYPKPTWFYLKCRVPELIVALTHKSLWSHFQVVSNLLFPQIPSSCSPSHTWDSPVWEGGVQLWSGADQFITDLSMHLECHCSHKAQRSRKIGSAYDFSVSFHFSLQGWGRRWLLLLQSPSAPMVLCQSRVEDCVIFVWKPSHLLC